MGNVATFTKIVVSLDIDHISCLNASNGPQRDSPRLLLTTLAKPSAPATLTLNAWSRRTVSARGFIRLMLLDLRRIQGGGQLLMQT